MTLSGFIVLSLNWARIVNSGPYGPIWRPEPYYNFTVELILYGIIFWVVAHSYVTKRDRTRRTAQLIGEETTSSEHDILTKKRIAQFLILWTVVIFSFTIPFVKTEFTVWRAENITVEKTESLFTIPRRTAISSGNYYSHDEILEKGTRVRFYYGENDYFYNAYIFTENQYSIFQKNISKIPEYVRTTFGSGGHFGTLIPNNGRYWFVLEFADKGTRDHYPNFSISIVWEEIRTIQEPRYFTKMVTLFDFLIRPP